MSTVLTVPSNLLSTYARPRVSSSTIPVGPSPTLTGVPARAPVDVIVTTLLEPMPVMYALLPSAFQAMPRGSPMLSMRWASGSEAFA